MTCGGGQQTGVGQKTTMSENDTSYRRARVEKNGTSGGKDGRSLKKKQNLERGEGKKKRGEKPLTKRKLSTHRGENNENRLHWQSGGGKNHGGKKKRRLYA